MIDPPPRRPRKPPISGSALRVSIGDKGERILGAENRA